jgi:prevent-host-death family protein
LDSDDARRARSWDDVSVQAEAAMEWIGIHAARAKLSELIDCVQSGEEVVFIPRGEPVARLVPEKPRRKRSRAAAVTRVRALLGAAPSRGLPHARLGKRTARRPATSTPVRVVYDSASC